MTTPKARNRNAAFLTQEELEALDFAELGSNVRIHSTCVLVNCQRMVIGSDVRIDPFCVISAGERMAIGSYVHIAAHCVMVGPAEISLADFAAVSHGSKLLSGTDDFIGGALIGPTVPEEYRNVDARPVRMERHTLIGAGTLVLPGAILEEGATVGALSLVKGRMEAWTVSAGSPARKVRDRDREGVLAAEARFRHSLGQAVRAEG